MPGPILPTPDPHVLPIFVAAPRPRAVPTGWPLLRPFYLAAALFACIAVPVWVAAYLGLVRISLAMPPLLWHGMTCCSASRWR